MKKENKRIKILLKNIHPNFKNPRKGMYNREDLDELKENMSELGQINPIKIDEKGVILCGHRRYQCAKELGWSTMDCEIITGMTDFEKSCILISDNATQRQFNAWDSREAINDIYWNEFCQEYEFKGMKDKGYGEFAKLIGVSRTTIRKIIDSMSKTNLQLADRLKKAGCGTELFDIVLSSPKKYKELVAKKAIELYTKQGKRAGGDSNVREILMLYKKKLFINDAKDELQPSFFRTIYKKIDNIKIILTTNIVMKARLEEQIKLRDELADLVNVYIKLNTHLKKQGEGTKWKMTE